MTSISLIVPTRRRLLTGAAAGSLLLLGACRGLRHQPPEEIVRERALARWDALIARDFETAWKYTQPGYRAVVKAENYEKQFGSSGSWTDVDIRKVECEPERCTLRLRLGVEVNVRGFRGRPVHSFIDEQWVRESGKWWYYQPL